MSRLDAVAILATAISVCVPRALAAEEPPTVAVTATDADASEVGPDPGEFRFERDGDTGSTLTVHFSVGGSATVIDYEPLAGSVTFPGGAGAVVLSVVPVVDDLVEQIETVELTLTEHLDYELGEPRSAAVSIADDLACTPSVTCKNQALIDAYEAGCEAVTDVCNWTRETLSEACQAACGLTEAAYDTFCNTTQATCDAVDGGCRALRDAVYDACLITGIGTGCNAQDAGCRAGCGTYCTGQCALPCVRFWSDACRSCVSNCSTSCNSSCTRQLRECKQASCPRDSGQSCFDCDVCEEKLDLECEGCERIAEEECDLFCDSIKPRCITEKQLGEECTRFQCAEGLRCMPDLTGFEGLGPSQLIESLLADTDVDAALDGLKSRTRAGEVIDGSGNILLDSLCLREDDGCRCSLPLLEFEGGQDLASILDTAQCVALYRPARHLQSWLVNQSIEGIREGLVQRWRDGGIKEDLLEGFLESGQWQSLAFAYGAGGLGTAGVGVVGEMGTVYGPECYGCYHTVCASAEVDLNVAVYGTIGVYDATGEAARPIKNLEGLSRVLEFGASIPFVEAGVSAAYVYPFPLSLELGEEDIGGEAWDQQVEQWKEEAASFSKEDLLDQFIPAGRTKSISLGLGFNPIVAKPSLCYTVVRDAICLRGPTQQQQCVDTVPRLDELGGDEGNSPPRAECRDREVAASDPPSCNAEGLSIDWGSWDPEGSPLTLTQGPPGPYPIGETTVTLTADDGEDSAICLARVTVRDDAAPELTCAEDSTHECQAGRQAAAEVGDATVVDCSGVSVTHDGAGVYPLGTTTVEFTATDGAEPPNSSTCTTQVTVEDTTAPEVVCPSPQVVECTGGGQAPITFSASATDACWGATAISCLPASGASFAVGDTLVACSATDGSGNPAGCDVTMTVQDLVPPSIVSLTATPASLWPPNRRMRRVEVEVEAEDGCDPTPTCEIVAVTSDEPVDGDVEVVGPTRVRLRAERDGRGDGRVYTIAVECRDDTGGNVTRATTEVVVPHDSGKS